MRTILLMGLMLVIVAGCERYTGDVKLKLSRTKEYQDAMKKRTFEAHLKKRPNREGGRLLLLRVGELNGERALTTDGGDEWILIKKEVERINKTKQVVILFYDGSEMTFPVHFEQPPEEPDRRYEIEP